MPRGGGGTGYLTVGALCRQGRRNASRREAGGIRRLRDPRAPLVPGSPVRGPEEAGAGGATGEATVGDGGRWTRFLSGLNSRFVYLFFKDLLHLFRDRFYTSVT